MAKMGNVVPTIEKLSTPHSEQMLMDIRSDGMRPNMKTANPCAAMTERMPSNSRFHTPPGAGKCSTPNIYAMLNSMVVMKMKLCGSSFVNRARAKLFPARASHCLCVSNFISVPRD